MILKSTASLFFLLVMLIVSTAASEAATVWDADNGTITFTKIGGTDPGDPANQDAITVNVALTRGTLEGLYNAVTETGYTNFSSPADTEWAFSSLNGNPGFAFGAGAEDFTNLTFLDWKSAHSSNPSGTLNLPGVVHLISDDIYIDIMFTDWGVAGGGQGRFTYVRAVPEASTMVLALMAAHGFATSRFRARRN